MAIEIHIAVASLVSYICEAVTAELLEDARLVRTIDRLEEIVQEEFMCVCGLDTFVLARVSTIIANDDYTGTALREHATASAHMQLAFLEKRIFSEVRRLPWSLARGNIEDNVASVHNMTPV